MNPISEEEVLTLLHSRDQELKKHLKRIKVLEEKVDTLEQKC